MSNTILVLGSTGKTGKRVAERLRKLQIPIRAGSRQGQPSFNWDNPSNWSEVLKGVGSVYITFQPDLAIPEAYTKIKIFTEIAESMKVKKLVLLSGRGEKEAQACEQLIMKSGMEWTILRASWFMQNFSENFLLDSILADDLILPEVKALEPFVDADDIAGVAVEVLTSNSHSGKIYELTGPKLLSFKEATNLISQGLNRTVFYKEISMNEYISALKSVFVPDDFIWLLEYLFTNVLDGRNESVTNDIQKITGKPPATFEQFVCKTIATGIWNPQ